MNRSFATAGRVALRAGERGTIATRVCLTAPPSLTSRRRLSTAAPVAAEPLPEVDQLSTPLETERLANEGQDHARGILRKAVAATAPRQDWTRKEIASIYYHSPIELAYQAVSSPS